MSTYLTSTIQKRTAIFSALAASIIFSQAHAAETVTVVQPISTTVVEQHPNGSTATITATPNSISMRDGAPSTTTSITQTTTQQVVGDQVVTTQQTATAPITTRAPIVTSTTSAPVVTTYSIQPVFSAPDVIAADTKVMKVMSDASGKEYLVPARSINSGDIIEYRTTYTNTTAQPVSDVMATVNLPNGVTLVSLDTPLQTLASSGGDSYQSISQVGDTTIIRTTETTPLNNYSNLRWNMVDLTPNSSKTVVMRAKIQ